MLRRFSLFVCFTLLMLAGVVNVSDFGRIRQSAAQGDPPARMEVGGINAENFPQLTLLVNVWDAFEVPVPGLTVDDFQVMANGAGTPVVSVENITGDNLPISVVLAIDTSESMGGEPLANAQAAALAFIDRLAPNDEVALIDFDSTVHTSVNFTTDRGVLHQAIEDLRAGGRTALYDAVYDAAKLAGEMANSPRRFVILLTDGNEYGNLSTMSAQAGVNLAVENNVPFYVFGLGYWVDEGYLNSLVTDSHGRNYLYPNSSTLETAYEYLATFLRTQYVVTIDSSLEPDGSTVELAVSADGVTQAVTYTVPDLYPQLTFEGVPEEPFGEPVIITAQTSAPRGLGSQWVTLDGEPFDVEFAAAGENTVSADIALDPYAYAPGEHTLELNALDVQGGARAARVTFAVADVPPVFEIVGPADGALISDDSFGISVNVTQAQAGQAVTRVEYRIDGQTVAEATDPPYVATIDVLPAGPGDHTLDIAVIDASGDETVVTRSFTVDQALFITPSPTPTATFTPTDTPTHTPTFTPTYTYTPTFTPTNTPEPTATDTDTPEPTVTDTEEPTVTDTETPEPTVTDTVEPTVTDTEEPTVTDTVEPTAADTNTPEPTETADLSATANAMGMIMTSTADTWTDTPEPTITDTVTPEPTATRDLQATANAMGMIMTSTADTWTATPEPTATDTETPEPTATRDLQATANAMGMIMTSTADTWTDTPEPTATDTLEPTVTNTEEPTEAPTAAATDTLEPTATDTEEPTEEPSEEPTVTDTEEPTEEPTAQLTPTTPPEPVDVDVDEGEGTNLTDYWPVCLGGLLVLALLYVILNMARRRRTRSGG